MQARHGALRVDAALAYRLGVIGVGLHLQIAIIVQNGGPEARKALIEVSPIADLVGLMRSR